MGRDDGMRNLRAEKRANGSGKWSQYRTRTVEKPLLWRDVDAEQIRSVIDIVTRDGDAVLFARTSNGDCLSLTICSGEARQKIYARSIEGCEAELADLENYAADNTA